MVRGTSSIKNEVSMSIALNKKSVTAIDLHAFSDTSIAAVIYVGGHQASLTYAVT